MEHQLVALLILNIGLFAVATGSVLHASEAALPYPQLLPYELTYSNGHSPFLLSQALGHGHGYISSPAPVIEAAEEDINNSGSSTGRESEQIQHHQSNILEEAYALTVSEPISDPLASRPTAPKSQLAIEKSLLQELSAGYTNVPPAEHLSSAPVPPLPTRIAPASDIKALDSTSRGAIYFDTNGKLQMQATLTRTSNGKGLPGAAENLPVPVVAPKLQPAAKASKSQGVANVNVNVHVNVNGDRSGPAYNPPSLSDANAPTDVCGKCN